MVRKTILAPHVEPRAGCVSREVGGPEAVEGASELYEKEKAL